MKEEKEVIIKLFDNDGVRSMLTDFPELKGIKAIADLKSPKEIRLCWLIANPTSPIFKMEREDKVRKAMEIVFGQNLSGNHQDDLKELYDKGLGSMPQRIKEACDRMSRFDPENRLRAKLMSQYMFDTLNDLITVPTVTTMDMDDRKKFADLLIKVSSELPSMLEKLETGYGVKTVDKLTGNDIKVSINNL